MKKTFLYAWIGFGLSCFCAPFSGAAQGISVPPSAPAIQYEGRMGQPADGSREIYWPGSSIRIRFRGRGLRAILKDQHGSNFYNIILDQDSVRCIRLDSARRSYILASGLPEGEHTVELFRRNGWPSGITWFYGFEIAGSGQLLRLPEKKRYIEFYGNSITGGSGMYPDSAVFGHENNYESYAALTARHFQAVYQCIARSGIGLMVSWFPMIMPEMYNRKNPFDSSSRWNFSDHKRDVVVINLGQNDYALMDLPEHPEFIRRFGGKKPGDSLIISSYTLFIQKIRKEYPNAYILCVLGNMDACKAGSPWPHYIEAAAASLKDPKVYTHIFDYKNTPEHPNASEHRQMAKSLIRFIDEHVSW
jgi:hypothetical protein